MKNLLNAYNIISWDIPAKEILAVCTWSEHLPAGKHIFPQFILNNVVFIPSKLKICETSFNAVPGTVIDVNNEYIRIVTKLRCIDLFEVIGCDGEIWNAKNLADFFKIKKGYIFQKVEKEVVNSIARYYSKCVSYEPYWIDQLLNTKPISSLPFLHQFTKSQKKINYCYTKTTRISDRLAKQLLNRFGEKAQLSYIILTTFLVYFYRINNYETFSFFFGNKCIKWCKDAWVPFFASHLPLTVDFTEVNNFIEALEYTTRKLQIITEQHTYFCDIGLRNKKILGKIGAILLLFDITDNIENYKLPSDKPFAIVISEDGKQIKLLITSCSNSINYEYAVKHIIPNVEAILQYIANCLNTTLITLPLMSAMEYRKILERWNNTYVQYNKDETIIEFIEFQAKTNPQNIAVVFEDRFLTYEQLNRHSNKLARYLRTRGIVTADTLIAICSERSLEIMIGILAILKAGAAYVPLDVSHPDDRLQFILQDTQAFILLTQEKFLSKFTNYVGEIIVLESSFNWQRENDSDLCKIVGPNNLAYVIYTSGTTGFPKGVQISHGAVTNHMIWMQKKFSFTNKDVILQKTIFSFDASVWELFIPLMVGGKLIFADVNAHLDPGLLIKLMIKYEVTTIQLVPSMLRELLKQDEIEKCIFLNKVFSGGELLSADIRKLFFSRLYAKLYNLYGPTEATIECTSHDCKNTTRDLMVNSIGKPINNTQVYILDGRLELVPIGIPGQLYIGGDGLAKGYMNNHGLTSSKFISNLYSSEDNAKFYKTGDLVRWLSNGEIEYLGRLNDQIKIRGFRIELGEIEAHLLRHSMINQCSVVVKHGDGDFQQDYLIAYLVLTNSTSNINITNLRDFLKQSVPDYMVPNFFVIIDRLPLSANGKVDKKALLEIRNIQMLSCKQYVAPTTDDERILADIWQNVLKIKKISIEDDFFELGGNSLSALHVLSLCKKNLSVDINISDFFNFPTIQKLNSVVQNIRKRNRINKRSFVFNGEKRFSIPSPIITLQPDGNQTPLFLIHPVGGTIFWYTPMIKYLKKNRPVYGIQDPGVELKIPVFSSIEEIADFYLTAIKNIQPNGPYIIGGASFGATVAVEIARKLQVSAEVVYCIPTFDGWAIYPDKLKDDDYFKETMQRQHDVLRVQLSAIGAKDMESLLELQWSRLLLLWKYKMAPVEQKIILFKAKELLPAFETIDAPLNYWNDYACQSVELHTIPGNHETMFQEPNVKVLAKQIENVLTSLKNE